MIKRADGDDDGEVNEKEFTDFMMRAVQYSVCLEHTKLYYSFNIVGKCGLLFWEGYTGCD